MLEEGGTFFKDLLPAWRTCEKRLCKYSIGQEATFGVEMKTY
jgi:hypothetical protein